LRHSGPDEAGLTERQLMTDPRMNWSSPPPPPTTRIRDHLANERTFLAWIRTALGLIGLGFVLARMGLFLRQIAITAGLRASIALPQGREFLVTGVLFLLLGTILCGWSGWHYRRVRITIDAET
jgi:putative membrane protein